MTARQDREVPGVEFILEDDGTVTARDLETGLQRGGETRAEALGQLAEVLRLYEGDGEPIEDEANFLEELGIDPEEVTDSSDADELPEFML